MPQAVQRLHLCEHHVFDDNPALAGKQHQAFIKQAGLIPVGGGKVTGEMHAASNDSCAHFIIASGYNVLVLIVVSDLQQQEVIISDLQQQEVNRSNESLRD